MDNVRRPRRPTLVVLGVGISSFRRILWTARTLDEATEAISLVLNPSFSKASIKRCVAASRCGAMMIADRELLTLSEWKEEEMDQAHEMDDGRQQIPGVSGIVPPGTKHLHSHTGHTPSSAAAKNVN